MYGIMKLNFFNLNIKMAHLLKLVKNKELI